MVLATLMLVCYLSSALAAPMLLPAGWLSTNGNQIVDQYNNPVRIAGIGWAGGDSGDNIADGLNDLNITLHMNQIVSYGFNTIRFPYNDFGLFSGKAPPTYITSTGANPQLAGKTPLQVMDALVAAAGKAGLKVIIDHHTNEGGQNLEGGQQPNGLWYDLGPGSDNTDGSAPGTVNQTTFKNNWVALAARYYGNPTVIGFDLTNEPLNYGVGANPPVSWGDGAVNDIHAMYTTVGNAILATNPNLLIICEGVISSDPVVDGTDLRGVATHPVTLTVPHKVVYSVHVYPSTIGGAPYDHGPNMVSAFNTAWGYIFQQNIAPIYIGECGASLDFSTNGQAADDNTASDQTDEQAWANDFVAYCNGAIANGPTVAANQQGLSTSWWAYANTPSFAPDGVIGGADWGWSGPPKPAQHSVYSQLQYTKKIINPSPCGTTITLSSMPPNNYIEDASGNIWTIVTVFPNQPRGGTAIQYVAKNGVVDYNTDYTKTVKIVNGVIWYQGLFTTDWRYYSNGSWSASPGQANAPTC